ncbi:DUF2500 family protein [[Clostridium] fimetarium]|uniref:Uncharacterized protein n=1 Tax=[Clostridium] fimetarium TaxID=99656 RepID=A0A1I0PW72_9FIRM|nr:DUF2500 family protein [[Clostridium] fimetarium]SEW18363.1 Protein of unknown function [[Clostridium] fimetarium]
MNLHKKKQQEVILVSKVIEDYHGATASYTVPEIKGTAPWAGNDGCLYKFYFTTVSKRKNLQFSVTREHFNTIQESEQGILEYKGKKFFSFIKKQYIVEESR